MIDHLRRGGYQPPVRQFHKGDLIWLLKPY